MSPIGDDRPGTDEGPGGRLRHEREERGLTVQQVAEELKLDAAVIMALEQNDFPSLGAPVFARGHLRRYATLLGMPDQELLADYDRGSQPGDPSLIPRAHLERMPERSAPRWPWVIGGLVALAVAAGVVGYVSEYGFALPWGRDEGADLAGAPANVGVPASSTTSSPAATSATPVPTGSPMRSEAAPASTATPGAQTVPQGALAPGSVAPGAITLDFRFAQDSWVEVFDGTGKAVLYDLGAAGSTRTLTAAAPLSVTIGNAPAVQLTINGKPVPLPAPEAGQTVIRVRIDAAGTLR
jgi:cytoskeleton protein RodZ